MFTRRRDTAIPAFPEADRCLQCPMCRADLDADAIAGVCSSCPLYHVTGGCRIDLIACPQCGYHSLSGEAGAMTSATAPPAAISPVDASAPSPAAAQCSGARRLSEVSAGTSARLLGFNGIDDNHLGRLTAYGLLPGVKVAVLQRFPAIILGVYQAELALETELAAGVWVLPEDA